MAAKNKKSDWLEVRKSGRSKQVKKNRHRDQVKEKRRKRQKKRPQNETWGSLYADNLQEFTHRAPAASLPTSSLSTNRSEDGFFFFFWHNLCNYFNHRRKNTYVSSYQSLTTGLWPTPHHMAAWQLAKWLLKSSQVLYYCTSSYSGHSWQ